MPADGAASSIGVLLVELHLVMAYTHVSVVVCTRTRFQIKSFYVSPREPELVNRCNLAWSTDLKATWPHNPCNSPVTYYILYRVDIGYSGRPQPSMPAAGEQDQGNFGDMVESWRLSESVGPSGVR